jgi:hypothetical protein
MLDGNNVKEKNKGARGKASLMWVGGQVQYGGYNMRIPDGTEK